MTTRLVANISGKNIACEIYKQHVIKDCLLAHLDDKIFNLDMCKPQNYTLKYLRQLNVL